MGDKPSWRERDRKKDRSAHRKDSTPRGRKPQVESATANYKRTLDAFFDRGVVPEHLKGKLPGRGDEGPSERQQLLRAIRDAKTISALETAVDQLRDKFGLPDEDMTILIRVLEHSKDPVLYDALNKIEAFLATGMPLPKKPLFIERLKGLEFTSFDPRVQSKALRLVAQLR